METLHCDCLIIGTGPAGLSAALTCAKHDRKVMVVEKEDSLGGVCVNTGTLPSKTLREAVLHLTGHLKRKVFAEEGCEQKIAGISMARLQQRLNAVRIEEHQIISCQLERNGIAMLRGTASFVDGKAVLVESSQPRQAVLVQAERIIIATGSQPRNPVDIPFDHRIIVDSTSVLGIDHIPSAMIILGGGVIGSEYATIFAALNVQVTLLDTGDMPLKFLDRELIATLMSNFPRGNIEFIRNCGEFTVERSDDTARLTLADGRIFTAPCLFFALGREANTSGLAIEKACVQKNAHHYIAVNELYQTTNPSIYAVGDVIGWPSLAATSILQGRLAALNGMKKRIESFPRIFPFGIYTIPEISYIGLTEEEATRLGYAIVVGRCQYHELPRAQITGECEGLLKMIVHRDTREILGVHIIGGGATEIIHIAQVALIHNGKIDLFIDNIFNYPTYSEALKIAALSALNQILRVPTGEAQCRLHRGDQLARPADIRTQEE